MALGDQMRYRDAMDKVRALDHAERSTMPVRDELADRDVDFFGVARDGGPDLSGPERMERARAIAARAEAHRTAALARDDGMARADAHASPRWKRDAEAFLMQYLVDHPTLFVDDVWDAGLPHTDDDRALGPIMHRLSRKGFMRKDGTFRPSVRSNLTEKPVWKSLLYRAPN